MATRLFKKTEDKKYKFSLFLNIYDTATYYFIVNYSQKDLWANHSSIGILKMLIKYNIECIRICNIKYDSADEIGCWTLYMKK